MSKFKLHGVTQDFPATQAYADPFGVGMTFFVRSEDEPEFVARERRRIFSSPVGVAIASIDLKSQLLSAASGFSLTDEQRREFGTRMAEGVDFSAEDISKLFDSPDDVDSALLLLAGWEGEEVPFSAENARELLTDKTWLPAGLPFSGVTPIDAAEGVKGEGRPLGAAICNFIRWCAHQNVTRRTKALETARGNLPASSEPVPAEQDA
jgi:hypothetical protein